MDSAIAPIANIKFDIEVALGRRNHTYIYYYFYLCVPNVVYRATAWSPKFAISWNGQ